VKILGLVSSPRRLGNSEIVVKEMMNRLPDDWDKQMIRLNDLRIDRCKGCYACLPKEKRCVLKDNLNFFLDHIRAAD
jgi:multimeric flavodoxin WrbA